MNKHSGSTVSVSLPAQLFYVPLFREFVSDALLRVGFSERFAYRTEIIVDELCSNAIRHGSNDKTARIEIKLTWHDDKIDLYITDQGGNDDNITNLKKIISQPSQKSTAPDFNHSSSLGLEIVKMLSEKIDLRVDENNVTSVHIIRKRETV